MSVLPSSLQLSAHFDAARLQADLDRIVANDFVPQPETKALYAFLNPPPAVLMPNDPTQIAGVDAFIEAVYKDLFNHAADAAGLQFWQTAILTGAVEVGAAVYDIGNGALGSDQTILGNKITAATYFTSHTFAADLGTTNPLDPTFAEFAKGSVSSVGLSPASVTASENATDIFIKFGAPVFGTQPTLTDGDNLTTTTPGAAVGSVLNADFDGPDIVTGLNIRGVGTYNIDANVTPGVIPGLPGAPSFHQVDGGLIALTGDPSGNQISDLMVLNFNDESNEFSLFIGNNTEPVQESNGNVDGFQINVSNAVGDDGNGVDVDFAAKLFTGHDSIDVTANVVGGFPLDDGGSLILPEPILGTTGDPDDYNPNFDGFEDDAYSIAAGASSGPTPNPNGLNTPKTGAVRIS